MANIGYARVSTSGQSLEAQLEALKVCDKVFKEKESGAKAERPQLTTMLDYVRDGDTVTVTKLCRLARNTKHLLEIVEYLEQKGVSLVVLNLGIDTKSPTGRLMLTMIGAVASFERQLLLERQAEGIAVAKSKGKYKGRKPISMEKVEVVRQLIEDGISKKSVSKRVGISLASVYRIVRSG
ncbi:resolvase domain-containing protein [Vibrio ichthyoenteri ATCC 700023]|uniref:Resolvase domain-containing protein n=1 Tax=Vibrio ichthyoenteri ATCC 700023 TaxID=870968 RepID=F9S8F4_9VIBR|nr:recombinase family protein [Vibrio ichthyoenteri]EGU29630.1 resolvase domain-containing protein [Vibrio ichthyoenteri ATCC 700023]